jgi:hypothetical protein
MRLLCRLIRLGLYNGQLNSANIGLSINIYNLLLSFFNGFPASSKYPILVPKIDDYNLLLPKHSQATLQGRFHHQ